MTPPQVVLAPGATCIASRIYAPLINELSTLGPTDVHTVELPSVNPSEKLKPNSFDADIAAVRAVLVSLIEEKEQDVVVIGFSYGGCVVLCAVEGLWESVRAAAGKKGGVTNVGLIASGINLPGDTVNGNRAAWWGMQGMEPPIPPTEMTDKGEMMVVVGYKPFMFSDMSDADGDYWESTLQPQAMDAMASPTPKVETKEWKASFLLTENDRAMPIGYQEYLIQRARDAGAHIDIVRINSGHFVMITHAREVAEWIARLAGLD